MHVLVPRQLVRPRERLIAPGLCARVRARSCMRAQLEGGQCHQWDEKGCGHTCLDRFDDSANALSQYEHLKGLWPLCVRLWIVSAPVMANDFPQPGKSQT